MKVLLCSSPHAGHVRPLLPLAVALRARGAEVVWATGADALAWLAGHGFDGWPCGATVDEMREALHRRWPDQASLAPREHGRVTLGRLFAGIAAPAMLAPLRAIVERWRPDWVVRDAAAFAVAPVCRAAGVPETVWHYGWPLDAARLAGTTEALAPLWREVGLVPPEDEGEGACASAGASLHVDMIPPSMRRPCAGPAGTDTLSVRPCERAPRIATSLPPSVRRLVESSPGRPLVYATFGTIHAHRPAFSALVAALACRPISLVVSTAGAEGFDEFTAEPAGRHAAAVALERWIEPQALLPWCDAIVSHGGAGTVLGALAHGVPQLVVPQGADQFVNAGEVTRRGCGMACDGEATAGGSGCEPDEALDALLRDERVAGAAQAVAREIAEMPPVRAVVERLGAACATPSR